MLKSAKYAKLNHFDYNMNWSKSNLMRTFIIAIIIDWISSMRMFQGRINPSQFIPPTSDTEKPTFSHLRFAGTRQFTILQMTDLHFGENLYVNEITRRIQHNLIKNSQPDVVVITGDLVNGYEYDGKSANFFKPKWEQATEVFTELKQFYAFTLGNHDTQADLSGPEICKLDSLHPYSLIQIAENLDDGSSSNYYLKVYSSFEGKEDQVVLILWFFDTRSKGCMDDNSSYGCLSQQQVDWYARESENLRNSRGEYIPGLAFFHIPLREYLYLWNFGKVYGFRGEKIACPRKKTSIFQRFFDIGNIKAMFCGHDHNNDFGGNYYGIELVYGRKTGLGSYGPTNTHGGRVIKISESLDQESGTISINYFHHILDLDGTIILNGEPTARGFDNYQSECVTD